MILMRSRHLALALAVSALVLPLASCGGGSDSPGDKVPVAAAFYPLAWVTEQVGGDLVDVTNLTTPGGEPHDLELSAKETADVVTADLVVYERGFQASVDAAVDNVAEGKVLDVATVADLQEAAAPDSGTDPHFWQDPMRMAAVADAIADGLGAADPDHRDAYQQRAQALRTTLEKLDADYRAGLSDCARSTIVVSHNAFGYLRTYGLTVESINGLSPEAEPSPADLARLRTLVEDEGITTVFSETLATPRLADTLAAEAGVATAVLDPIEGLSDATADQDYLSLMRANLSTLEEANGC
jgi:zinc transport system substrate-binding protein